MIHSDALTEAPCTNAPFGIEESGVIEILEQHLANGKSDTLLRDLLIDFYSVATLPLPDDLTALFAYRGKTD
jgi:hypothetical protein